MAPSSASHPAVSVIIAVHNGLPYLEPAVRSILGQTLRDIEVIVTDDASTDGTAGVLERLATEDGRLRVIRSARNEGAAGARNRAINHALAPYVAVMDADDIAHPERLARQTAWLDAHPGVVLLGASNHQIDRNGAVLKTIRRPLDPIAARWFVRFDMPLTHPTVMFRRYQDGVFPNYPLGYAEDYGLVAEAFGYGEVAALPDILLDYRVHPASTTGTKWRQQQSDAGKIALRVQNAQLSPRIVEKLAPFRAAYFDCSVVPPEQIFDGLLAVLTDDVAQHSTHASWMKRQAAQLARMALHRSGCDRKQALQAFLGPGRSLLPSMASLALERRNLLPPALRSDVLP